MCRMGFIKFPHHKVDFKHTVGSKHRIIINLSFHTIRLILNSGYRSENSAMKRCFHTIRLILNYMPVNAYRTENAVSTP